MQIEITLTAPDPAAWPATDLGYLLHKNPERPFQKDVGAGMAHVFYAEADPARTTAVLFLDIDPIALVRGKGGESDGPLAQYVNDRPYVANSFLSVALGRVYGQSLSGKSKERQALADQPLPLSARVTPVAVAGAEETIAELFEPLGYQVEATLLESAGARGLYDLRISAEIRLRDLLSHLYVLTPVLDNAKHYWIDRDEIEKLLEKGEGWLAAHPAKDLIARRALGHRRGLVAAALDRLADAAPEETPDEEEDAAARAGRAEEALEQPIRLHDLRLETVATLLKEHRARSVLDLGCGEGRLLQKLVKQQGLEKIVGVDPSSRSLERAARRLRLEDAGAALRERLSLRLGSLTYGDRRWRGFDAAALVEVIEHIDPPRLASLALSLFGDAKPGLAVITTPNREYNALFESMPENAMRHGDHRFEWSRAEFQDWCAAVATAHGYRVAFRPLGPEHETLGAPSQMAVFERGAAAHV